MWYFLTFLVDLILYNSKFSIQFQNFLDKPLYSCLSCNDSILDCYL